VSDAELPPDPDAEGLILIPDIPQPSQDRNEALDAIEAAAQQRQAAQRSAGGTEPSDVL